MKYIDLNKIIGVFKDDQEISRMYSGPTIIWEKLLESCFGKGFWKNNRPWLNTDGWKNN